MKIGDKVKYRDLQGEVTNVMGDGMVIVKMPDGKEYPYQMDMLTVEVAPRSPMDMAKEIAQSLRPHLKNMNVLNAIAAEMHNAGIAELSIRAGQILGFSAKESLQEKIERYKAEALAEAERKANEEFERENSQR